MRGRKEHIDSLCPDKRFASMNSIDHNQGNMMLTVLVMMGMFLVSVPASTVVLARGDCPLVGAQARFNMSSVSKIPNSRVNSPVFVIRSAIGCPCFPLLLVVVYLNSCWANSSFSVHRYMRNVFNTFNHS